MYKRILIATDGSPLSDKAVESGLSLAALTGASVVALKVVPRYPRSYFEGGMVCSLKGSEKWGALPIRPRLGWWVPYRHALAPGPGVRGQSG